MKRIIIFTSNDEIFSFRIVEKIINYKKFKNFDFEIILTNPPLIRKIKLLLVVFFSGGIHDLLKIYNSRVKKKQLIRRNVRFVSSLKKKYNFGISINYLNKRKRRSSTVLVELYLPKFQKRKLQEIKFLIRCYNSIARFGMVVTENFIYSKQEFDVVNKLYEKFNDTINNTKIILSKKEKEYAGKKATNN